MKVLVIFCLSLVLFGVISADEGDIEKNTHFLKCIACGSAEAQASYEKCKALNPEKVTVRNGKCYEQVFGISEEFVSPEVYWQVICEKPNHIKKLVECEYKDYDEFLKSLTEEEKAACNKYKDCAKGVAGQYCSE